MRGDPTFFFSVLDSFLGREPSLNCDFEHNMCHWKAVEISNFYFGRYKGQTPSRNTGPDGDNTKGKNGEGMRIFNN